MTINSFRDIVDLWGSYAAFTKDMGEDNQAKIRKWYERDSIPSRHWDALVEAAKLKAKEAKTEQLRLSFRKITPSLLIKLASREAA